MRRLLLALPLLALTLPACDSTGPNGAVSAVFALSQGAFGNDASGAFTPYDPDTGITARTQRPGGLVQAGLTVGDELFLLLNFSDSFTTGRGRIEVVSTETNETVRQIEVGTPRGAAAVDGILFVSDLYGGAVTPVDLASGATGTPIAVGDNPEGVAVADGRVFVANSGFGFGTTLSVIDPGTRAVVETVELGCAGPNEVVADRDGDVWVVCTGRSDFTTGEVVEDGQVVVVDGTSLEVVARFAFAGELLGGAALGQDAAYDADRQALYVIQSRPGADDTVLRYNTRQNAFDARLTVGGEDLGGVGFGEDRLYLARLNALNPFSDDGAVTVHERDGEEIARFDAGVVPAAFAFARD